MYHFCLLQLVFEGIRGEGSKGDIAIDDIDVSFGDCNIVPRYADPKQIGKNIFPPSSLSHA